MSGIEIAGLVMGVLPLVVEASRSSSQKLKFALDAIGSKGWYNAHQKFYKELYWETGLLQATLDLLVESLPDLSSELRIQISEDRTGAWATHPEIRQSLSRFFQSSSSSSTCDSKNTSSRSDTDVGLGRFKLAMDEVSKLFCSIIEDNSKRLLKSSGDHEKMHSIMQKFLRDSEQGMVPSDYLERAKFLKKAKNREGTLKSLSKWNKRLRQVVEDGCRMSAMPRIWQTHLLVVNEAPSDRLRTLARDMFDALSQFWSCQCVDQHHAPVAKLCLEGCTKSVSQKIGPTLTLQFQLLLQRLTLQIPTETWSRYETTVQIQSKSSASDESGPMEHIWRRCKSAAGVQIQRECEVVPLPVKDLQPSEKDHPKGLLSNWKQYIPWIRSRVPGKHYDNAKSMPNKDTLTIEKELSGSDESLKMLCAFLQNYYQTEMAFRIEIKDYEQFQNILKPTAGRPGKCCYSGQTPRTLRELFNDPPPELAKRRQIALTLAYSLFQLYESPFLSKHWDKAQIQFFADNSGIIDFERPYIDASIDRLLQEEEAPIADLLHKSLGILRLGILLIEVYLWKPIEDFVQDSDLIAGTATVNSFLSVASRILRRNKLGVDGESYRSSVEACLWTDWETTEETISLQHKETRDGVYQKIIRPLEWEVELIKQATEALPLLTGMRKQEVAHAGDIE
ncbi:hypothetical protein BJ508DRAFT_101832 [Ascobolus immersus RN42]|uniref:DUF7580 domain-containing protein n=1 Tax=Ascobolus immersus RN42 TaxID=1160509 RepID=A0A3N4HE63_ASCIM|nr:hypothetical protein BJ508DRAFT_101832 [Ascobolus immersus RN42]